MSITGNLRTLELAELLQWLAQGQKTGALVVENGTQEKRIYFDSGKIISAESNNPEEHLGRFLIREGAIDQATLSRAVKLQESTQILLGKVLVTLGSISQEELHRILRLKIEESLYELFTWPEGEFHFVPDDLPELPMVPIELDVTNIVLEGMKRIDEARHDSEEALGDATMSFAPVADDDLGAYPFDGPASSSLVVGPDMEESQDEILIGEGQPTDHEDSPSTEVRGYYHSGAHKTATRTPLLAAAAAAAVIVAGLAAYFFMRPEPAEGTADRGTLESGLPTESFSVAESFSEPSTPPTEATLAKEPVPDIPARPAVQPRPAAQVPPRTPAADKELRDRYETELAALRNQLQQAQLAAAERDSALERLRDLEEKATEQEAQLLRAANEGSTSELEMVDVSESEFEVAAGGDEPPTLADLMPVTEEAYEASTGFTDEIAETISKPESPAESDEPVMVETAEEDRPPLSATPPVLVTKPTPSYPVAALRLRREATVTVRILVDERGEVVDAEIVGPRAGLGFDQAALIAAQQTSWKPGTQNGAPAQMWTELRIAFRP